MFSAAFPVSSCIPFPPACVPSIEGTQVSLECPPSSDPQQVERLWKSVLLGGLVLGGKAWLASHSRLCPPLPLAMPHSGLWFPLIMTGVLQQGRGPPSSDMLRPWSLFQSADCHVGEDHSVPPALKGSALSCPCRKLSSVSSWRSRAWVGLWMLVEFSPPTPIRPSG